LDYFMSDEPKNSTEQPPPPKIDSDALADAPTLEAIEAATEIPATTEHHFRLMTPDQMREARIVRPAPKKPSSEKDST
jgi:hypothetical protein